MDQEEDMKEAEICCIERATESDYKLYSTMMSKQVTKSHVRDSVHMYLVN